jgi:hypothetical protein
MRLTRALLAALALGITGCATGFAASPRDWAAYRQTRVAPTLEQRLAAAQRYLKDHPDGAFRDEVRAHFDRTEALYYASKKDSRAGLEAYLAALPNGPHKEEAYDRIEQLYALTRKEADEASAEAEARISGPAATARAKVREELGAWITRFLDPKLFLAPFAQASAGVIVPFSLSLPSPRCVRLDAPKGRGVRRCIKLLSLEYTIDVDRKPEPREAIVEVTVLESAEGVPVEIGIGGPDLFLRIEETVRVKAVPPGEPAQRAAATARALKLIEGAFTSAVPGDDCQKPPIPPVALSLACGGVHLDVIPAGKAGEDDRIVIGPLSP